MRIQKLRAVAISLFEETMQIPMIRHYIFV